jgi:hypothetical protein
MILVRTNRHCLRVERYTRSLIGGFLQTRSVDVINQASFFHKAPGIGELHNLSSWITL